MNAIPWYQSPVMVSAVVAIISQLLVLVGKQDLVPIDVITTRVEAFFQIVALGATLWAAWKRKTSTIQPVTLTQAGAAAKSQGGFARPLFLAVLLALTVTVVATLSGCTGTRAAYKEAQSPDEYAFVLAEHYASLVREAADLKARPTTSPDVVAAMQKADLAAQPLVDALRPLRDAYIATKSATDEAALQAAINSAVLAIADLVRSVKAARGTGVTMLEQRILFDAELLERSPA